MGRDNTKNKKYLMSSDWRASGENYIVWVISEYVSSLWNCYKWL